ncbi:hypothetical protein [Streptomyces sp. SID10815]|uniref:hypothetical protein n=1 Tax=Streptomyces sp. SID10815 TaxID=2706027 RepID=UPI0013CA64CF|nr:hypothetical protein [Streptomyces sp. SID10815]NEA52439.1 hypothetical protein [Streptomyces sp. SID10815]
MTARDELRREMVHNHLYMTEDRADELIGAVLAEVAATANAKIQAVRDLHRPVEHSGITICAECSGWDGETTDNSPCGYEHCPTLRALDGRETS